MATLDTMIHVLILSTDKDKWINVERARWAKYFSVPICDSPPEGFPVRTLAVQRALCVVSQKTPTKLPSVIEALYHSFWVQSNSKIGEPAVFAHVIESVLGQGDTKEVLSAVSFESSCLIMVHVLTYCPDDTA
jgi:2-hydroxychromene-2-carboxylate isomerase